MKNIPTFEEFKLNEAISAKMKMSDKDFIEKNKLKLYFDKNIQDKFNKMVKDRFIENEYSELVCFWYNIRSQENKGYLDQSKLDKKELDNLKYFNQITKLFKDNEILTEAAYLAWEISKEIKLLKVNREEINIYDITKEYFKNFGLDYSRSKVFDETIKKLDKWAKDNKID